VELKLPTLQSDVERQQNFHLKKNTHPCWFQEFKMMDTLNVFKYERGIDLGLGNFWSLWKPKQFLLVCQ
jgi:hypothetical protein